MRMLPKKKPLPSLLTRTLGQGRLAKERLKVLLLTFLSYMCFHASRIPPSITKGVLHPHSESANTVGSYNPQSNPGWLPFSQDLVPEKVLHAGYRIDNSKLCSLDNAGKFSCSHQVKSENKDGSVSYWCNRYTSKDFKFKLNHLTGSSTKTNCGIANSTRCWEITAIYENITSAEKQKYCTDKDCALFVQSGGYRLPAEVDSDTVQWVAAHALDGNPPDVVPEITNGKILLGSLMTVYLLFYAGGMFVSGHIADQVSLRLFLSFGMMVSGILVAGIGFARALDQHSLVYFYSVYAVQGLFQSIGWPTVVAVMGNWFDKSTRGFVMTVWNSHTSVGNIVGKALSSFALGFSGGEADLNNGNNWPATFFVCGGLISSMSVFVFCFLKNSPEDAGLQKVVMESDTALLKEGPDRENPLLDAGASKYGTTQSSGDTPKSKEATGILRALAIPGVVEFALSLFFCKFVAYTFIYWLPYYLGHVGFPAETAGYLSIFFDLGGIPGGVLAGVISDKVGDRGVVIFVYLALTIPSLYAYRAITENLGDTAIAIHVILMLVLGALVNGPYALITTAVSADLGQHQSLKGSKALMATVAGIIDGTGSVGAAAQGLVIGALSSSCRGWDAVFSALQFASAMSAICLVRMLLADIGSEPSGRMSLHKISVYAAVLALVGAAVYNVVTMVEDCGVQDTMCT